MFTPFILRIVRFCRTRPLIVILLGLIATVALGTYVRHTLAIDTNTDRLVTGDLPWVQRDMERKQAFPNRQDRLVIVIDTPSADSTTVLAGQIRGYLESKPELFKTVTQLDSLPFLRTNGLLLLQMTDLEAVLNDMIRAQPLFGLLSTDPSWRGMVGAMTTLGSGVSQEAKTKGEALVAPLTAIRDTVARVAGGEDAQMAWQTLFANGSTALSHHQNRSIILTQPTRDYSRLQSGQSARDGIRAFVATLNLPQTHQVRMTGTVALDDDEFATLADDAVLTLGLSIALVLLCLFLALRSWRIIVPILLTLGVGLVSTTAFAMATIGSLNLISVAFAVMFIGIAVDFGIQIGVRFRDVSAYVPSLGLALHATLRTLLRPLGMATVITVIGFLAFVPTAYRGVAELGIIAGAGIVIALILNITFFPALLVLFRPHAALEPVGFRVMAPVDAFLARHRRPLLAGLSLLSLLSLWGASHIRFDADPLNLKDPTTESVATLFDLMRDPYATPYTGEILAPNLDEATILKQRLEALPEVRDVLSLDSFVPHDQEEKLDAIREARDLLMPALSRPVTLPPPTDAELVTATTSAADAARALAKAVYETSQDASSLASQLAESFDRLAADPDSQVRVRLQNAMMGDLPALMEMARTMINIQKPIILDDVPDILQRDWVSHTGAIRLEVYPKGDARDPNVLKAFVRALQSVVPDAGGAAVSIYESGQAIFTSFMTACGGGLLAMAAVSFWFVRRGRDVFCLIAPFVLAGALTLATMAWCGRTLNFANVIGLPLLLSLGISYAIYVLMAWRDGQDGFLQSATARAVLFSAATTAVAFGTLMLSSHLGMRSMGELLTLSLVYSLLCTGFALPLLLGSPRKE